jgi:type III secretion system-like peptide-binding chaperone/TIR domain-containing protein
VGDAPLRLFYSYSHRDERMLERLQKHLSMLRRRGLITEWSDRAIEAGSEWRAEIARELDAANVILLLVSADFLASDFCWEEEMKVAVERADRGDAKVIAVMLRPVDGWDDTPFAKLQVVPKDGRPITRWADTELAFSDAAGKIRTAVQDYLRSATGAVPRSASIGVDGSNDDDLAKRSAELAEALDELRSDQAVGHLIVNADAARNYYAQFAADGDTYWCEVVANEFLEPADALDDAQVSRLGSLGWGPPAGSIPNWWFVPDTATTAEVAILVIRTLRDVYGVSLENPFEFNAFE